MKKQISLSQLRKVIEESVEKIIKDSINNEPNFGEMTDEEYDAYMKENKCPKDGCVKKKPNGKWGVISGKTGKFWDADYDSEQDAKDGLQAYFVNK